MNNELSIREEESVRLHFPGGVNDLLLLLRGQVGHVVNELPRVRTVRDHKPKLERELAEDAPTEIMPLNHLHVVDGLRSDSKEHGEANRLQLQEVRSQVVLDETLCRVIHLAKLGLVGDLLLRHVHEHDVGNHVANAEPFELEVGPVITKAAQECLRRCCQSSHVFWSHVKVLRESRGLLWCGGNHTI